MSKAKTKPAAKPSAKAVAKPKPKTKAKPAAKAKTKPAKKTAAAKKTTNAKTDRSSRVTQLRAHDYKREETTLGGWPVGITTYRVGETWICKIDNVSPGAVVARGRGASREAAVTAATERATPRMAATRRVAINR